MLLSQPKGYPCIQNGITAVAALEERLLAIGSGILVTHYVEQMIGWILRSLPFKF